MNPAMNRPDWLTARPIAHRGFHDKAKGIVENSGAAALAAISGNFAIECDVQESADGQAIVFHDFTLERLTQADGRVKDFHAADIAALAFRGGGGSPMALPDFLALIDARTPLICEIKSRFDGSLSLARRVAQCVAAYAGPVAIKSFDPVPMAHLRANAAALGTANTPLGMVAQADYGDPADEWALLSPGEKAGLQQFLHWEQTRPDFLSWGVNDLPNAVPLLCRKALGMPVMTWTVRTSAQTALAEQWADQIIFEGLLPQ